VGAISLEKALGYFFWLVVQKGWGAKKHSRYGCAYFVYGSNQLTI
jgi:hypothetical protein